MLPQAPEILAQNIGKKKTPYTFASDVYAFGICVFELITSRLPYRGYEDSQIVWQVAQGTLQPDYGHIVDGQDFEMLKAVSEWCISYRPGARPTFKTVSFVCNFSHLELCSDLSYTIKIFSEQAKYAVGRLPASITSPHLS